MTQPLADRDNRICKVCRKIKVRIFSGKFDNQKDKRYTDETGKQWSGSTCPSCHAELTRKRMRKKRAKTNNSSV
jgi:hypothetical protein